LFAPQPRPKWPDGRDLFGRGHADLGEWLVLKGLALDCPSTRTADMIALSTTPNALAGESGRAAMSSRGLYRACIRANGKPAAFRMTQTRIPKASEHAAFILNLTGGSEI
jgi:hypothetical protein